jgi:hypothetical protein
MSNHHILLIAGVHRQELEFGQKVIDLLQLQKCPLDMLIIPQGLSNQFDSVMDTLYRRQHEEMYHQIKGHIKKRHSLIIDLHAGCSESFSIDLFSSQAQQYPCLKTEIIKKIIPEARAVNIKANLEIQKDKHLTSYTILPKSIWKNNKFIYVGIEVYLEAYSSGNEADIQRSANMIDYLVQCHINLHAVGTEFDYRLNHR